MGIGDADHARFPIELDIDVIPDTVPQVGLANSLFPDIDYDNLHANIIPITGTGGKSKGVVIISGRRITP